MKVTGKITALMLLSMTMLLPSCCKDDEPQYVPPAPFSNGAFISNEGTFGQENASVSFYDFAGDSTRQSIFEDVNGRSLGKLLQSMYFNDAKIYLVLNMSNRVTVVNADDFVQTGVIDGLELPRYMTSYSSKGYITQWGNTGQGSVKVIELGSNTALATIPVGTGPEQAIVAGGKVLVCNGGGYTVDSTISVIDPLKDKVEKTVEVGDNPKEMVTDRNGDVWVICFGYIKYDSAFNIVLETPSKLVKLSGQTLEKTAEYIISLTNHPQHIDISPDRSTVYFGGGFGFAGIYAMSITAGSVPASPLIGGSKYFYGFNVNPANGEIYALDAGNFTTPGLLFRYSAQGTLIKQYPTGIAPNAALFR